MSTDSKAEKLAKARQGTRTDLGNIPEKIPGSSKSDSRDQAGSAAGVNGRYVDMASQIDAGQKAVIAARLKPFYEDRAKARKRQLSGTRSNPGEVEEKIPQPARSPQARDEAGSAAEPAAEAIRRQTRSDRWVMRLSLEVDKACDKWLLARGIAPPVFNRRRDDTARPEPSSGAGEPDTATPPGEGQSSPDIAKDRTG